ALPRPWGRRVAAVDRVAVDTAAADTAGWARMVVWPGMAEWAPTPWVAASAAVDSAAAGSRWVGTARRVRSPSMVAAGFTAHASTAVFAALSSPAAPPTPTATITASIAVGGGIPAATAT